MLQVLGDNLLSLIKAYNYKGIPLHLVKRITQQARVLPHTAAMLPGSSSQLTTHMCEQVLSGLDYLHSRLRIIHTDLKPENVMLTRALRPSNGMDPAQPVCTPGEHVGLPSHAVAFAGRG